MQLNEIRGETEHPTKRYVILPRGRGEGFNEVVRQLRKSYQKVIHCLAYTALAIPALPPALFPFFQPYTFGKTTLFEIVVEAMAIVWLASHYRSFTTSDVVNWWRPVRWAGITLVIAFAISTMLSADVSASFWGSSARMDGLFTLLHFFAFFLLLASSLSEYAWHLCMRISVGAGTFSALYAIAQWFNAPFVVASAGEIFGTLGNPSYLALYLLFTIFLAHYLAEKEERKEVAIILYCAVALQVIALLLTQVQAGLLALGVGTAVALYPYLRARITLVRGILMLTTIGALFLLFSFSANFAKLASLSEGSVSLSNRIAVWNIALSGITKKPFFGHGANTFEPYYLAQKNDGVIPLPATGETFDKPHNAYLEIAFSYGIIGLMAYLFFVWVIVRRAWRTPALAGACIAYFIFLFFFFDTFTSYLMFFFVAAFLARDRNEPSYLETRLSPTWKPSFQVGATVALILLFFVFHYQPLYSAYFARQFLLRSSATHVVDEPTKAQALRHRSFNAPFIERAILLAERAMKK